MNQCCSCSGSLLSVRQVAEQAGLSQMAIYRAINAGELRAARLRGKLRIRPEDFERWVDENTVETPKRRERIIVSTTRTDQASGGSGLRDLLRQQS